MDPIFGYIKKINLLLSRAILFLGISSLALPCLRILCCPLDKWVTRIARRARPDEDGFFCRRLDKWDHPDRTKSASGMTASLPVACSSADAVGAAVEMTDTAPEAD